VAGAEHYVDGLEPDQPAGERLLAGKSGRMHPAEPGVDLAAQQRGRHGGQIATGAELVNVIADGEQVVAEWTARGIAKTGKRYDNRCLGVFTVHDNKITSVREYTDTQHVERVLFTGQPG
jgi:ketosteroid isomerase-like protein